jgi:hypothetical protein
MENLNCANIIVVNDYINLNIEQNRNFNEHLLKIFSILFKLCQKIKKFDLNYAKNEISKMKTFFEDEFKKLND